MRLWYLASDPSDLATTVNPPTPIKAFIQHAGSRVGTATPSDGYPFTYDDDGMAELWFRIKEYTVSCNIRLTGTDGGGDNWDYQVDFGGAAYNDSGAILTSERQVIGVFTNGAQGGFAPPSEQFTANRKIIINGVTIVDDTTPFGFRLRHGSAVDQQSNPTTRYQYGTASLNWLPNLYVQIGDPTGSGDISGNSLGTPVVNPGFQLLTTTATFRGEVFTYFLSVFDFLSIDTFTLSIDAALWWEYRKSDGSAPIWDQLTGARIRTPITQIF